jgi:hypothetical protein
MPKSAGVTDSTNNIDSHVSTAGRNKPPWFPAFAELLTLAGVAVNMEGRQGSTVREDRRGLTP